MFKCQREPFLRQFETTVVSCEEVEDVKKVNKDFGLEELLPDDKLFKVILEDTILFPEGGGQPDDRGTVGGAKVIRVIRDGTTAVHYLVEGRTPKQNGEVNGNISLPFEKDQKVSVDIDWTRRFDNMQQHSGQHLVTAIADQMYGFATTSWYLGKDDSFIELDTKQISKEQLKTIEDKANAYIRESVPCTVEVVELDDPKLKTARGRNLPDDVKGNIRIVTMHGIESNVCCGTHVQNVSQLQAIKLLDAVPKKGKTHLFFLSGNRVLKRFDEMHKREGDLMKTLKTNPADLPVACEKMNVALRNTKKALLTITKSLAALEAKQFLLENDTSKKLWHFHRDNVDVDYASTFIREMGTVKGAVVFLTFKCEANSGNVYIIRGEDSVEESIFKTICEEVSEMLCGKGSLRGNQYQAKVTKVGSINKAVSYLENALKSQ